MLKTLVWLAVAAFMLNETHDVARGAEVPRYGVFEAAFVQSGSYADPYSDAAMKVTFTHAGDGRKMTVDGFWNGGTEWLVRFAPDVTGAWSYRTESADKGLGGKSGGFECVQSASKGFIRVNPKYPRTFMDADGTPFYWLGDTNWDFANLSTPLEGGVFQQWIDTRAEQGFTVIQGTLEAEGDGKPPRFSGKNEGGMTFLDKDREHINPAYFQYMDKRVSYIMSKGLVLAFWFEWSDDWEKGFNGDKLKIFTRYVMARYGAYNVIYGVMGEYQEIAVPESNIADAAKKTRGEGDFIKSIETYGHLLSTHTTSNTTKDFGKEPATTNKWIDFHGQQYWEMDFAKVNQRVIDDGAVEFGPKPVVDMEFGYEEEKTKTWSGKTDDVRRALWAIAMGGGYGTYAQSNIGWNKQPGRDWKRDATLPGAWQAGYLRKFFESMPWWEMGPENKLLTAGKGFVFCKPEHRYVVYLPWGGEATLDLTGAKGPFLATWFDPREGKDMPGALDSRNIVQGGAPVKFTAPDDRDWVLKLEPWGKVLPNKGARE